MHRTQQHHWPFQDTDTFTRRVQTIYLQLVHFTISAKKSEESPPLHFSINNPYHVFFTKRPLLCVWLLRKTKPWQNSFKKIPSASNAIQKKYRSSLCTLNNHCTIAPGALYPWMEMKNVTWNYRWTTAIVKVHC